MNRRLLPQLLGIGPKLQRGHWQNRFCSLRQRYFLSTPPAYLGLRNICLNNYSSSSGSVQSTISELKDLEEKSMINSLIEYKARYGDCHIPTSNTKNAQNERKMLGVTNELADWVVKQRKLYRRSKKSKDRIQGSLVTKISILESIGFMWSCREAQWQRSFNKLEQLYMSNNEGSLLRIKKEDNPQLYEWTKQQRKAYKHRCLPIERETLLREINFVFEVKDERWWENYKNLCLYHEEHNNTLVPMLKDDESPNYLGQWVARQRRLYHSASLSDDRINALNKINFSWDPEGESWENYYKQLCDFHREHNHTRVPKSSGSLWNWVDRQRRSYRKRLRLGDAYQSDAEKTRGTLITKENVQKLSNLGFEWKDTAQKGDVENRMKRLMNVTFELSIHDENWAKHFDTLCAFHEKFNHFSIPTGSSEYKELHNWVRHTRFLYNSNKLPGNRVELLEKIGFAWTAEDAKWDRLYEEFLLFHQKNGHSDVPVKNTELYRWTKEQKENNDRIDQARLIGTKAKTERKKRLHKLKEIFL